MKSFYLLKFCIIAAALSLGLAVQAAARGTQAMPLGTLHPDTIATPPLHTDSTAATADSTAAKKQKKAEEPSEYEKLTKKGGTTLNGLFIVRHIEDKYYFEVPDSLLGRLLLCVTRFTAVPQGFGKFPGEEAGHCTLYFEQRGEGTLLLRQYVLSYLATEGDNIARTLEKATVDPIVMALKVIGRNKENSAQMVEVTPLFKGDNSLAGMPAAAKTTLKLGALSADRTFIDTMKVYPQNVEIATTRTYSSQAAASAASRTGSVTLGLNTSVVLLPKEPMRKRLWDSRVGYFVNQMRQFSDDQRKAEHEAFVSRYRLVPKDKKKYLKGQLSEPEKPIVYYIDPATPKKWVPYLMQGIDDWRVAFEAAGFKNAIVAREWPEDDASMSVDDARFSVLRYLPSETENAYGPRIVDPRSGEIIEAHICWYHNVMNLLTKWYMVQCGPLDKRARQMQLDDRLMGQLIRFVSSHEVGHTLGLRHNMGASFATPVEKLRDKQWVEAHGHTASIMDYARFNYVAQPEDGIGERGLFPRIGDYDKWAIKWGYQWRPEFKDEFEEKEQLMKETTAALREGGQRLWFGGEGQNEDPRAQTEDLGDNSVKASEYGIRNLKRVVENLLQWTHQDNDQYDDLRMMYKAVTDQYSRYLNHVLKNVGTHYLSGMPGQDPVAPVPAWRQKEAVEFLGRHAFDAPEWLYPADIVAKTATNPATDWGARQQALLGRLMQGTMLTTLYNTSTGHAGAYQLPDYLDDLFAAVWQPLASLSPWKAQARRDLQRAYVQNVSRLLGSPREAETKTAATQPAAGGDALLYVQAHMQKLDDYCRQQRDRSQGLDRMHYDDLLRQLQLIRDRLTKER